MRRASKKLKGFTLVELIVVVAIIAILASLVTLNILDSEAKSRDSKRMADVNQIWKAVELYKTNNSEKAPQTSPATNYDRVFIQNNCSANPNRILYNTGTIPSSTWFNSCSGFQDTIKTYLNPLPQDPGNQSPFLYAYGYNNVGSTWYFVFARLENQTNANFDKCYAQLQDNTGGGVTTRLKSASSDGMDGQGWFSLCH